MDISYSTDIIHCRNIISLIYNSIYDISYKAIYLYYAVIIDNFVSDLIDMDDEKSLKDNRFILLIPFIGMRLAAFLMYLVIFNVFPWLSHNAIVSIFPVILIIWSIDYNPLKIVKGSNLLYNIFDYVSMTSSFILFSRGISDEASNPILLNSIGIVVLFLWVSVFLINRKLLISYFKYEI